MDHERIKEKTELLMREVRTMKAYCLRVETQLEELQNNIGRSKKAQTKKEIMREEIRQRVRLSFNR